MPQQFAKDPEAVLDYQIDWSAWLDGDTIAESSWSADEGITIGDGSHTTTTTTVVVSDGVVGRRHVVTNRIVTAGERTDERSLLIVVGDK
jgi:hypothetical protein